MTHVVAPKYPYDMTSAGISGTVLIQVVVLPSGEPDNTSVKVIKPLNPLIDQAAVRALLESRFSPGYLADLPVRVSVVVPYKFVTR
jgi:TonB family protein